MSRFRIQLEQFRAVHNADIELNGITVLAGENSTGKSTISKFFYHVLNATMTFEYVLNEEFIEFCRRVKVRLDRIYYDLKIENEYIMQFIHSNPFRKVRRNIGNTIDSEAIKKITKDFKMKIESIASNTNIEKLPLSGLNRILEVEETLIPEVKSSNVLHQIIDLIDKKNKECENNIKHRKEKHILAKVNAILHSENNTYTYDISIDGISLKKNDKSIEDIEKFNSIYIQPTHNVESVLNDNSLEKYLLVKSQKKFVPDKKIITSFTSKKFLDGDIRVIDNQMYYVQNNTMFSLEDCASGINSVAQLYLLYKNGYIDENSVIIIDEPEVHLHPSWIVEYAKLIILLRKNIRATFLIATHSPDMVRAIKDVSEQEGISKEYNFYISKPHSKEGVYTYIFENQGQEINEIFSSFNQSLDKLEEYTGDEESEE